MNRTVRATIAAPAALLLAAAALAAPTAANATSPPWAQAPQRIVSLSPSITEWLFALGADDQVVAVDSYSTFPAGTPVTELSGFQPNLEAISTYEPDLVLLASDRDGIVDALEAVGIPALVVPAPNDLDSLRANVVAIGGAVGHTDDAAAQVEALDAALATATEGRSGVALTYYWELSDAFHTVTSETLIGALLQPLELTSIADEAGDDAGAYPQVSAEFVVDANPDIVIAAWAAPTTPVTVDDLVERPGWAELTAVEHGRVIVLDSDVASRWGPRVVDMVGAVADALPVPTAVETIAA